MNKTAPDDLEAVNLNGSKEFFIPQLCTGENLLLVLLLTELVAIMFSLLHVEPLLPWLVRLGQYSLYMQWVALTSAFMLCGSRKWLLKLTPMAATFISLGITSAAAVFVALLMWLVLAYNDLYEIIVGVTLARLVGHSLLIAFIINALCLRYMYVAQQWRQRIVMANQANMQALLAKIRPHFLFNTMNTIGAVVHDNPERAEQAIIELCSLLRVSLEADNNGTFQDELALCRSYLSLESLRLGERLRLNWQVDTIPKNALVPPMTLQLLLENSVYHGIETLVTGGEISICGGYKDGRIQIDIINDIGDSDQQHSWEGHHKGLAIARTRLHNIFADKAELTATMEAQQYKVRIGFPYLPATSRHST